MRRGSCGQQAERAVRLLSGFSDAEAGRRNRHWTEVDGWAIVPRLRFFVHADTDEVLTLMRALSSAGLRLGAVQGDCRDGFYLG